MPSIALKNISYTKGSFHIPTISADIAAGTFLGIIGANGSGKSTLMKLIAGLLAPDNGQIIYDHILNVQYIPPHHLAQLRSYAHPDMQCTWNLRGRDLLMLGKKDISAGPSLHQKPQTLIHPTELEKHLNISPLRDRYIHSLSSGEKARLMMARLFQDTTPLMIVDEPLSFLDFNLQLRFLELSKLFTKRGGIMIASFHELKLLQGYVQHLWLMEKGSIIKTGTYTEIMQDTSTKKAFGLTQSEWDKVTS